MKTENVVLMKMAKESLSGQWGLAIGAFIIYFLVVGAIQVPSIFFPATGLLSLIIAGPMAVGVSYFSLSLSRRQQANVGQIFSGFYNFGNTLGAYLLMVLFVLLWSILLIIPGIIAAFSYSMTFFIMAEDTSISPMQALDKSKAMMNGYKAKLFRLYLRFLGWALLCVLTLGIGYFWLIPWIQVTFAKFYDDIKDNQMSAESI
ncbi:MAG: DUF975 family protein [Bacteroidales bacterium]|nr:DUF975 family protein [Bacteroidales bacterium]